VAAVTNQGYAGGRFNRLLAVPADLGFSEPAWSIAVPSQQGYAGDGFERSFSELAAFWAARFRKSHNSLLVWFAGE
jgi:hypothetical protein